MATIGRLKERTAVLRRSVAAQIKINCLVLVNDVRCELIVSVCSYLLNATKGSVLLV